MRDFTTRQRSGPPTCPLCTADVELLRWPTDAPFGAEHTLAVCGCGWYGVHPQFVDSPPFPGTGLEIAEAREAIRVARRG